ncbi:MAG: DksA/TraR family C4-type zinc finger protein [Enterobacterales bacterium endosymbiont of Blomia tropicalis]|uniref:DksA/TraR family C4-type zinc finger protein n=1 Tax=Mixta mediterraneensis TaxID=2758443 RepID=UPI0025A6F739|nr:DksA/TraR family C4-type zinc finger protein [Mixta mediterraneensis]MDL4912473.1 DksA/TraR family C4-type zinc finger protein [Mixta mediterraneensis]
MANGWASEGAVQEQIDSTVNDEITRVRQSLGHGESATECEACGEPIPEARRRALQGVRYCVACQEKMDKQQKGAGLFNRRGSKDSQLR